MQTMQTHHTNLGNEGQPHVTLQSTSCVLLFKEGIQLVLRPVCTLEGDQAQVLGLYRERS